MQSTYDIKKVKNKNIVIDIIMKNIGIFIALGLMEVIFSSVGWFSNESIAKIIMPIKTIVLPLSIGCTAGHIISGYRGANVAIIATIAVVLSSDQNMVLGAIIVGIISGFLIKEIDKLLLKVSKAGFEMIINNFIVAIVAIFMAILSLYIIGPILDTIIENIVFVFNKIIEKGFLPLTSILIEPAKILFLNNTINHIILSPLGMEQALHSGKSILFLLESNPGIGLGILLATYFYCDSKDKKHTLISSVVTFFGGIHEVYFPYILKRPLLIIAAIGGGMASIFTATLLDAGLVSTASPGSIITLVLLTPKGHVLNTIIVVFVGTFVSFILTILLFRLYYRKKEGLFREEKLSLSKDKLYINEEIVEKLMTSEIKKIVFACDTGVGSSAMGATSFKRDISYINSDIVVTNSSVDRVPKDADVVVSHIKLKDRCKYSSPDSIHIFIDNFMEDSTLEKFYSILEKKYTKSIEDEDYILTEDNIILNLESESKEEAIARAGKVLMEQGYINNEYINSMQERESVYSTYIGMGVAIPHGLNRKDTIKRSGVVILQYPNGVKFENNTAFLVIGVAAKEDDHMDVLSNIALSLSDKNAVERFNKITDKEELIKIFKID